MYFSRTELLDLLSKMLDLCGREERYSQHFSADVWNNPIDARNPNAKRFDLSGALCAAVDALCDPPEEYRKLKKLETHAIESKRTYAKNLLRKRGEHARILYGYGWAMLNAASHEVTGDYVWKPKSFQTAIDVLERAKLRLCESLGIANRERSLGMCRIDDPYVPEELLLLEKITSAGELGYKLQTGDELLASYDLYRRGLITEVWPVPLTYRRRMIYA